MGARRLICFRRRRLSSYLCVLVFFAIIYFIFQGTSLRALSGSGRQGAVDAPKQEKKENAGLPEKKIIQNVPTILGIRSDDLLHYEPDEDGLFHCINGMAKIPMASVNDEYCDCLGDGSDEPGTDACPNARFYCNQENKFVPSGKVNDGICDCCDGSDEWKIALGSSKVKGFPPSDLIQHAPCIDVCSKITDREREGQRVKQIGLRLKQQYIARAQGHASDGVYGKQGEFYQLSKECYDHADFAASYHICPWQKVEQTQKGHQFRLGRDGQWDERRKDRQILVMDGGDSRGCSHSRRTEIEFICGLSNTISKLYEQEKCVYIIEFITPAAC